MRIRATAFVALATAVAFAWPVSAVRGEPDDADVFILREPLGQDWAHDPVSFILRPGAHPEPLSSTLVGPDGSARPFQVEQRADGKVITFLADLPADGESRYRLVAGASPPFQDSFAVERTDTSIRLTNGITGIEVPCGAGDPAAGPVSRIRLASGRWVGAGRLVGAPAIEWSDARVVSSGPVVAEIEWRCRFAGGGTWTCTVRLVAGEPVLLFRETVGVSAEATWELAFGGEWAPDRVTMMPGTGPAPYATTAVRFDDSTMVTIGPWIQWWDAGAGTCCAISSAAASGPADDMLVIAAGDVAAWARSEGDRHDDAPSRFLRLRGTETGSVAVTLPLVGPGRSWMLATVSAAESDGPGTATAPFHAMANRWMETPLDDVKAMMLVWERGDVPFPVTGIGRERLLQRLRGSSIEALLEGSTDAPSATVKRALWPRLLAGPDGALSPEATAVKHQVLERLDSTLAVFRRGNRGFPAAMYGTMIPRVDIPQLVPALDMALAAGVFTPGELERLFGRLAFLAEKLASPDYVSPERSLAGNPNMVTSWSTSLVLLAAMMPRHPRAEAWFRAGMGRLEGMLDTWQGPDGAWLEAPHYHLQALDPILTAMLAARHAGLAADPLDERLLRTALFLARISTPPDPGFGDLRHVPPLGNTYRQETSMLFGALAALHAERHPEAAAELQWVWQQQGRPRRVALGGAFFINFHADELLLPEWSPPAPGWSSRPFAGFGAVFRAGFPGPRETYLVHHQGEVSREHYDDDQGSFEFWGKGRPLCLDWGYRGFMTAALHNRVGLGRIGSVRSFVSEPAADHLVGVQGAWTRHVMMVRDTDPLGPNYIVLRDRIDGDEGADWRLWCLTRAAGMAEPIPGGGILERPLPRDRLPATVSVDRDVIRFTGAHDVDLDVWLAAPGIDPVARALFEHGAVLTVGGTIGGGWSGWDDDRLDQIGIRVAQPPGTPLLTVLYPRLRDTEVPVTFTSLAEGRGVRIEGPWGTDHVFLADEPLVYEQGPIRFRGTVGLIQRRGAAVTLSLCADGEIADGPHNAERGLPRAAD